MNIRKITLIALVTVVVLSFLSIQSCRKQDDFKIDEFDHLSDSLHLQGSVAIPVVNTEMTLFKFVPKNDSTLFAEEGADGLVHVRMYLKNVSEVSAADIWPDFVPNDLPAASYNISSNLAKLKIHDNSLVGHLFFYNPEVRFIFKNQIPASAKFVLDTLAFYDANQNEHGADDYIEPITGLSFDFTESFNGQVGVDTLVLNKINVPQMGDIFSPIPKYVSFKGTISNDAQTVTGLQLTDTIKMDLDIDLPCDVKMIDLAVGDTSAFPEFTNYEQAKQATLRLQISNGFPFEIASQVIFFDENHEGKPGKAIDSVFTDSSNPHIGTYGWKIPSATTTSGGIVTFVDTTNVSIILSQERLKFLNDSKVKYVVVRAVMNTRNPTGNPDTENFVKIYPDYKIGFRMGMRLDFEGSTTDIPQ